MINLTNQRIRLCSAKYLIIFTMFITLVAMGEQNTHEHHGFHVSHPLFVPSPLPENKVRLEYAVKDIDDLKHKEKEHEVILELEYAFNRSVAVELKIPYTHIDKQRKKDDHARLDNMEIGIKFANFSFEDHNLSLGYGVSLGLPTGDDNKGIGNNHELEIAPFINFGFKFHNFEFVGETKFLFPTNQEGKKHKVTSAVEFGLAVMYPFGHDFTALLELTGENVLHGTEDGLSTVNLSPGIKMRPLDHSSFEVGLGASFPVSTHEEFDYEILSSLFWYF